MQLDTFKKKNLRFIYNGYTKWYERLRSFFLWTYYFTLGQRVLQLSCVNWRINFLFLAEWILESKILRNLKQNIIHVFFFLLKMQGLSVNSKWATTVDIHYKYTHICELTHIERVSPAFLATYPQRKCCLTAPAFALSHPL